MTETTIRQLHGEEMLDVLYPLTTYAFSPSPPLRDEQEWKERMRQFETSTVFALFEDGKPVASVAAAPMIQQVNGKEFEMGGVWGVATQPSARRKGYCKQLMTTLLETMRAHQQPLTCLYPFRETFYQRLGYITFPQSRKVSLDPATLAPLLKSDLGGEVERMLISEGYDLYRDYLKGHQQRVHGMAYFKHPKRAAADDDKSWLAVARVDGQPVGVMLYSLKGEEVTLFTFQATRFYYHTSQGKYLLLNWIARHVDQAKTAEIWLPSFERPETWLADLDVEVEKNSMTPMGRVLDIAEIGGMETGNGVFSARISDPTCPWNEGVWQFDGRGGSLDVSPAQQADCDLTIQALSALVYGAHEPADFPLRGWGNPSPALQTRMREIFPPKLPYIHEFF
jgi:predicted acetyltransferase